MNNSQRSWLLGGAGANLGFGNQVFQPWGSGTWFLKRSLETVNFFLNSKSSASIASRLFSLSEALS